MAKKKAATKKKDAPKPYEEILAAMEGTSVKQFRAKAKRQAAETAKAEAELVKQPKLKCLLSVTIRQDLTMPRMREATPAAFEKLLLAALAKLSVQTGLDFDLDDECALLINLPSGRHFMVESSFFLQQHGGGVSIRS